jgi:putative addiction module component (TIGR02574 family)
MTNTASALLADALRLSEAARAELAAELLASLDGPADTDAQQAWETEIGRRIAAIESGSVAPESWDDVKHRVAKDVLGR